MRDGKGATKERCRVARATAHGSEANPCTARRQAADLVGDRAVEMQLGGTPEYEII
ncbi:MAG: hypothetical protein PW786_12390 [Arachidicoccus sp.]|nr:hypothetical protein [Arachidicoccus sp.]